MPTATESIVKGLLTTFTVLLAVLLGAEHARATPANARLSVGGAHVCVNLPE